MWLAFTIFTCAKSNHDRIIAAGPARHNLNMPPLPHYTGRMSPAEAERICAQHDFLIVGVASWKKWNFDPHTQDDVAQAIRLDALKSLPEAEDASRIECFIKKIAIRRCIDEVRRQVRTRKWLVFPGSAGGEDGLPPPEAVAGEEFNPVRCIFMVERARLVGTALKQLDENCAATIDQFYFRAIPYKEIAEKMGISINTVASRLSRCMDKLKQILMKIGNVMEDFAPWN